MRSFCLLAGLAIGVCSTGCRMFEHQPKEVKLNTTAQEFTVAPTGYEKPADLPREEREALKKAGPQLPAGMPGPGQPGGATPSNITPGRPSR